MTTLQKSITTRQNKFISLCDKRHNINKSPPWSNDKIKQSLKLEKRNIRSKGAKLAQK